MPAEHSGYLVTSTTDSEAAARALAGGAIEARLAACAQVLGPITSVFRWAGATQTEQEWRVELKTAADRLDALAGYLRAHHPYDVPEIIAAAIAVGDSDYLSWLVDETRT
jgi:periplasmic divalent cation tolerance protein